MPIGRGCRVLIKLAARPGKTAKTVDTILHQKALNRHMPRKRTHGVIAQTLAQPGEAGYKLQVQALEITAFLKGYNGQ